MYMPRGGVLQKNRSLLLVALSAVIMVIFAGLSLKRDSYVRLQISEETTGSTLNKEENSVDEASSGVYTNHKYRFRFRYPENTFITFQNHHPEKLNRESYLEAKFTDTDLSSDRYPNYTFLVFASESENNEN